MRRSTRSSTPSSSRRARAARAQHADAVRLVDHQPGAVARAELGDLGQRRRRRPPSRRRRRRPRGRRRRRPRRARSMRSSLSRRLWRKGRSLARESRQPSRIEAWSPESAMTVSPGPRIVAERAEVGLVAGREDDRVLGAHPVGELAARARGGGRSCRSAAASRSGRCRSARARRARRLDALVAGQPEVVVGAEHDPLGALHLHDRAGRPTRAAGSRAACRPRAAARRISARSWSRALSKTSVGGRHC